MGKNRKHHYLPKSLLKMFVFNNDSIWQFSKSKNKIEQKMSIMLLMSKIYI